MQTRGADNAGVDAVAVEPGQASEPMAFPAKRQCPFDPARELTDIQAGPRVQRVRIWNGTSPWLITGFDLVRQALASPKISADTDNPSYPAAYAGYAARRKRVKTFLNMDDPRHIELRRYVTQDFTVKRAEALRPKIQEIVDGLIDDMLATGNRADLVQAFALPLPSKVICEILGVPYEDRERFLSLSKKMSSGTTPPDEAVEALEAILDYLGELVDRRTAEPSGDMISRLVEKHLRTGALTREELVGNLWMLLAGGHDTTMNMISLGTAVLLQNPDLLDELRTSDEQEVIARSVEELLRYLSIIHLGRRRVAIEDMEIGGCRIAAGEGVIIAHETANRDPEVFPNPDAVDFHRDTIRQHLAFGYGVHQCLGQSLARVELQVVNSTLYRRIPTMALAVPVEELRFKEANVVYGVEELPIVW